jgi:hypothetical protein
MAPIKPKKLVRIERTREVHTYAELWHGSYVMLRIAKDFGKGQHWLHLSSIVLAAFTFEAYLNHVGERIDRTWKDNECLPVMEKFRHISALVGMPTYESGKRPLQTLRKVIEFRNEMAHARSETLTVSEIAAWETYVEKFNANPLTKWEKLLVSDSFPKRAREDIKTIMSDLHALRMDAKKEFLFIFGMGSGTANVI